MFYEIYVRSFQDSNGNGVGDLRGMTSRLPYLADLGVDAIWITPFYPSPQVDFGYDVSDHEDVDPQYGDLRAFDDLVAAAHRAGLRVVIDVVLNHTSDRHPWFIASRSSRTSPSRDWYVWRDGRDGQPPTNWESAFGGPAWTFDAATGQWYYHAFYREQPDLNWRNPAVEARMFETVRFWLDRGVDGFRLDAVNTLFEDERLRDNPLLPEPRVKITGVVSQEAIYTRGLPEMHATLERLRRFTDARRPEALLVSEAYVERPADLVRFYGNDDSPAMHLPFNFFLAQEPALSARGLAAAVGRIEAAFGDRWPSLVFNNHDIDRAPDRIGNGADSDAVARLLAIMLLTLRGTPFLYYGEEIGMRTEPPQRLEDVRDPVGRVFWPRYKGRDGSRRPMAWDASAHGGFTRGEPWLAAPSDAATRNVAVQERDARSVLSLYRRLLAIRRRHAALHAGRYREIASAANVFAFLREQDDDRVLVLVNCSTETCTTPLPDGEVMGDQTWAVLAETHRPSQETIDRASLTLSPLEGLVLGAL